MIGARSKATGVTLTPEALKDPQAFANFQHIQDNLSGALSRLLVTVEKYPEFMIEVGLRDYYLAEADRLRGEFEKTTDLTERLSLGRNIESFLDRAADYDDGPPPLLGRDRIHRIRTWRPAPNGLLR